MTPKKAYNDQWRHARDRNIEFNMSYDEWLEMWLVSGNWANRGKKSGQYVMCRYGDVGPYSVRNCYIGTVEQNGRDRWEGREKITNQKALEIYDLYTNTEMTQAEIGKLYNINPSYVSRVVSGKRKKNAR